MLNPLERAHLPAVRFAPRAYMGCGGWDLALAPETTIASVQEEDRIPSRASRSFSRPRRMAGGASLSCGSGGYMPEFMKEKEEELSGRTPTVRMGCGEEMCEECEKKRQSMGCSKCKRIRKHAMMNQEELEGSRGLGQAVTPDLPTLVTGGLVVFGLFFLATR